MISFLRYLLRGFKWKLIALIMIGILGIVLSLSFVYCSKLVIDIVTHTEQASLVGAVVGMTLSLVGSALLRLLTLSLSNHISVNMGNAIRSKIFGHLLYARWESLKHIQTGDMLTRIIKDTDDVVNLLASTLPSSILALVQLLAAFGMMYFYSPTLALMLCLGMPLVLVLGKVFYRKMLGFSREYKQTESLINSHMQESLGNQTLIRTFERQEGELDRLRMYQHQLYEISRRRVGLAMFSNFMSSATFSGGYLVAFLWSAYQLGRGAIQFGTVTTFLQLIVRIQRPMLDLLGAIPSIIASKASFERLVSVLDYQLEQLPRGGYTPLSGSVELIAEGLAFKYTDGQDYIFEDFDLKLKPGAMLAVMGATGAGKTTLLRLLLGLIKPTQGTLALRHNGGTMPISEATRSNFVYVPQGNTLLCGTIRENLLVGDPTADDAQLREVLKIAIADFVWELPKGLDTQLGERGAGLSEGQAQRIAIARSLLRPGRILLLDEATSALDLETEHAFLANLRAHIKGRIVIFITHHQEVADACDSILKL